MKKFKALYLIIIYAVLVIGLGVAAWMMVLVPKHVAWKKEYTSWQTASASIQNTQGTIATAKGAYTANATALINNYKQFNALLATMPRIDDLGAVYSTSKDDALRAYYSIITTGAWDKEAKRWVSGFKLKNPIAFSAYSGTPGFDSSIIQDIQMVNLGFSQQTITGYGFRDLLNKIRVLNGYSSFPLIIAVNPPGTAAASSAGAGAGAGENAPSSGYGSGLGPPPASTGGQNSGAPSGSGTSSPQTGPLPGHQDSAPPAGAGPGSTAPQTGPLPGHQDGRMLPIGNPGPPPAGRRGSSVYKSQFAPPAWYTNAPRNNGTTAPTGPAGMTGGISQPSGAGATAVVVDTKGKFAITVDRTNRLHSSARPVLQMPIYVSSAFLTRGWDPNGSPDTVAKNISDAKNYLLAPPAEPVLPPGTECPKILSIIDKEMMAKAPISQ